MSGDRIYAVGDIHGHAAQLDRALDLIAQDGGAACKTVFLGDLVDRGPDSPAVIDQLMTGLSQGRDWHVLMGNHDRMFIRFLRDGRLDDPRILSGLLWFDPRLGGVDTLAAYGVADADSRDPDAVWREARDKVPPDHLTFLEDLPRWHEQDDLLFVHAGIAPGVALADQDPEDFLWIRKPFLDFTDRHPWLVVHGHTSVTYPEHAGNRINLDGGAGYGRPLHPAVFEDGTCWLLKDEGREPLTPRAGLLGGLFAFAKRPPPS